MSDASPPEGGLDARLLAQERIVDALLRALALKQPDLLNVLRNILVDTEFTHPGKPRQYETAHQQIRKRIDQAARFAEDSGTGPKPKPGAHTRNL